jgi:hypothetical protein
MSTESTSNQIRAFIIPHDIDQESINEDESDYSQAGNRAGDPIPQQASALVLRATGQQAADSDIQIKTVRSGHAGSHGEFVWYENLDGGATSDDFGRDIPAHITGYDVAKPGSTTNKYQYPNSIALDDGSLYIVVYAKESTWLNPRIYAYKRSESSDTYTAINIHSYTSTPSQAMRPAICKLPNGNLLAVFTVDDNQIGVTDPKLNLISKISKDDGATWSLLSDRLIDIDITLGSTGASYQIAGVKVAAIAGQVLLLVETFYNTTSTAQNRLWQFASIDGGATFTRVTTSNDFANGYHRVSLAVRKNSFVVSYIADTNESHYMQIPHAFYSIQSARNSELYVSQTGTQVLTSGSTAAMSSGEMSMCIDDNDNIFLYYKLASASHPTILAKYSTDGIEFNFFGNNFAQSAVYDIDDTTGTSEMPKEINVVAVTARVAFAHNFSTALTNDETLAVMFLGGYSTLTMPFMDTAKNTYKKSKWLSTYVPYNIPSQISAFTVSGTGSDSINVGRLYTDTNSTTNRLYSQSFTTTLAQGVIVRVRFEVDVGGNISNNGRIIDIKLGDGSDEYYVRLRIGPSLMQLFDIHGSVNIGPSMSVSDVTEVIIALQNNDVKMWYFSDDTVFNREYEEGSSSTTLTNGGAGVTGAEVIFGHGVLAANVRTYWHEFHVSAGIHTGQQMAISAPDLSAMLYPPAGQYIYVADGVRITTADGPAIIDDEYQIKTRYTFGIDKAFYKNHPSTKTGWRSASVSSGANPVQEIVFDALTDMKGSPFANYAGIGIHLQGLNAGLFKIYSKEGSGSWTLRASVDSRIQFYYKEQAGALIVSEATQSGQYINFNECAGWPIEIFDDSAAVTTYTKVVTNTEGALTRDGTRIPKTPVFYVEDEFSNTDPDTEDQIAFLIPPNITIVMNMPGTPTYDAIKIEFVTRENKDKYFSCSHISIGPVVVPGQQYGRGRTISRDSGTVSEELLNGTIYSRNLRDSKRTIRVSWSDPIDIRTLSGTSVAPNYIKINSNTSSMPIGTKSDVPGMMLGLITRLQGQMRPLIYLPSIDTTNTATTPYAVTYKKDDDQMLAVLQGDISIESVIGDELINEAFRVSTIVLREV